MKLKNIKISNYRCFKEAEIDCDDYITLVVGVMKVSERPADIKQRMDLFYAYMDENNYKEADKVLLEMEAIVGTTDPDIAAARTSLDLENIGGIMYDRCKKRKRTQ